MTASRKYAAEFIGTGFLLATVVGSGIMAERLAGDEILAGLFRIVEGVDPAVETDETFGRYIERMGEDYAKMSKTPDEFGAFVEQISHMWASQPDWSKEELQKITTPTVIVAGDHDEAILRAHTDYMASVIPGATEVILPDVSHFAMLQAPDEYNKAVIDFVDGM